MNFSRVGEGVFFIHPERVLRADACRQHGDPLHRAAASFNHSLQRTQRERCCGSFAVDQVADLCFQGSL